ncbi:MAG: glycoside hydrolase family 76 protein [Candidatus Woesearchaeota archaeon]
MLWIGSGVPSCGSQSFQPHPVSIEAFAVRNGRYTRLLLVYRSGRRRVSDLRRLQRVRGMHPAAYEWFGPHTRGGLAPGVSTRAAGSVTQTAAVLGGTLNPNGRYSTYYFRYGASGSYGSATARRAVRSGRRGINLATALSGLNPGTTYHYRIYATNAAGAACSPDRTFTTLMTPQQSAASRAVATYKAMQQRFYAPHVYSGDSSSLYTENYPQSGRRYSFLWPFSRVMAGTITLAGIPSALLGGTGYQADVADRLTGLSHYWENSPPGPGYASYPAAPYGGGGDKYYDDQAWVGLAAAQNYALTGDPTSLADAKNVFNFVYPGGWASSATFDPGGIYWVNQGIGVGAVNHDRTTTSNAPNAEIALLLENSDPAGAATYDAAASAMYGWVNHYLYNVDANPTDPNAPNPNYAPNAPALMFDKVTGNNAIDQTLYTYNQGTMIAANVREYQKTGNPLYLSEAEAIARTALSTFNESYYISHSAAFNAIYFRGLLVLYSVTGDTQLQSQIIQTIQTYANDAWNHHRSSSGLFSFSSSPGTGYQLLDQGAMLQIYAMLAWNPSDYGKLP